MLEEVKAALREAFPGEEGDQQVAELEEEIGKTGDVQEKGRMLMDVMDYLQNPPDDKGEEGAADEGEEGDPPYPGEEGLQALWKEVTELCNEEDIDRLEDELKGKSGEEQWNILLDVRDYLLNGDEEEQQAFGEWNPSTSELESEWKQMLKRVPPEEVKEVKEDWKGASPEDKKRMVWDVRKFLEQQARAPRGRHVGALHGRHVGASRGRVTWASHGRVTWVSHGRVTWAPHGRCIGVTWALRGSLRFPSHMTPRTRPPRPRARRPRVRGRHRRGRRPSTTPRLGPGGTRCGAGVRGAAPSTSTTTSTTCRAARTTTAASGTTTTARR